MKPHNAELSSFGDQQVTVRGRVSLLGKEEKESVANTLKYQMYQESWCADVRRKIAGHPGEHWWCGQSLSSLACFAKCGS